MRTSLFALLLSVLALGMAIGFCSTVHTYPPAEPTPKTTLIPPVTTTPSAP